MYGQKAIAQQKAAERKAILVTARVLPEHISHSSEFFALSSTEQKGVRQQNPSDGDGGAGSVLFLLSMPNGGVLQRVHIIIECST